MRTFDVFTTSGWRALASITFVALAIHARPQSDVHSLERSLKTPAPIADGRVAKIEHPEVIACTKCHSAIAAEWSTSAHALSWLDPIYQEDVKEKKRPEGCWGCHVPEPLHSGELGQKPPARAEEREVGIRCESCHAGKDGEVLGPFGAPTEAHKSIKSEHFVGEGRNLLCSSCHRTNIGPVIGLAKDFETARLGEQGLTCVGCHMAPIERAIANAPAAGERAVTNASAGDPAKELAPRAGHSHALQSPRDPAFLRLAFDLTARVENGRTIVRIQNRAGHRVPGLIGRSITFKAEALSADGKSLAKGELEIDHRSFLPVADQLEIALGAAAASVHVVGLHFDPRLEKQVSFCDEKLTPGAAK
jgi:hypothetical protein